MSYLENKVIVNPYTERELHYIDKSESIVALVVTRDLSKVLLETQFRAGTNSLTREGVAGAVESGQSHEDALYAEMEQEVGLLKSDVYKVIDEGIVYPSAGFTNERSHMYIVILNEDFSHKEQKLDKEEKLTYEWVNVKDVISKLSEYSYPPLKTMYLFRRLEMLILLGESEV